MLLNIGLWPGVYSASCHGRVSHVPRRSKLEEGREGTPGTQRSAHALNFREILKNGYPGNFPCNGDVRIRGDLVSRKFLEEHH